MVLQDPLHRFQEIRAQRQSVVQSDLPLSKQMRCSFLSHQLGQYTDRSEERKLKSIKKSGTALIR